jgi:hypothetical protein
MLTLQEKSKLEAQLKQLVSQKQLLDKSQGKQENIEAKKRESIMVVGPSTEEAGSLSVIDKGVFVIAPLQL